MRTFAPAAALCGCIPDDAQAATQAARERMDEASGTDGLLADVSAV